MTTCPATEILGALIGGDLPPDLASTVRAHVEGCPECLGTLDRLTDDPELASWMAEGSGERATLPGAGPEAAAPAPLPTAIGPYAIEAEVGRGGMGVVYRARDPAMGRVVALKVLRAEGIDRAARERFVREVRALARVEHDHVVRVYTTSGPDEPVAYFAMEYLAGPSLAEEVRDRGRIDPRRAARVVAEVASGLAAAHASGLVHRDVKPANVLFDASGRAKVGDFGLALLEGEASGLTRDGVIAGTPAYLSPEQARGGAADARSDVYALGVTLYECLAGESPFRGSPHRVVHQVLHNEPLPPRTFHESIPRNLETIALKAMAKEPDRRYRSASALADDLGRWLGGEPIAARPVGTIERIWRSARRRPAVSALAAALGAAVVAGFAGVSWQWRRAEANAREANGYLRKTLESVDAYFVKVSESRLLDVPNLQPLRRDLLAAARDYYEALLRDRPGDPAIRLDLARARAQLAVVVSTVGTVDEAIGLFRQALSEFDRIVERSPDDPAARFARLFCLINLAKVQIGSARYEDARATYLRVLDEAGPLRRLRPGADEPLKAIYSARHGLGTVALYLRGDLDAAIAEYERALAINQELLARKPDDRDYLRNVSRTAGMLVNPYEGKGRTAESRAALDRSYGATRRLVAEHPEAQDYRFALAALERSYALIPFAQATALHGAAAMAKMDEARQPLGRALALDRDLVRENPRVAVYRTDFLGLLWIAAALESASGRNDRGLEFLREAREAASPEVDPDAQMGFDRPTQAAILGTTAVVLAEEGRAGEARPFLDQADRILASLTKAERTASAHIGPQAMMAACYRGQILLEAGDPAESLLAWDRACELAPAP